MVKGRSCDWLAASEIGIDPNQLPSQIITKQVSSLHCYPILSLLPSLHGPPILSLLPSLHSPPILRATKTPTTYLNDWVERLRRERSETLSRLLELFDVSTDGVDRALPTLFSAKLRVHNSKKWKQRWQLFLTLRYIYRAVMAVFDSQYEAITTLRIKCKGNKNLRWVTRALAKTPASHLT